MAIDHTRYNYYHSKTLNQDFAENKKTGNITFVDGTRYRWPEIKLLKKNKPDAEKIKQLHLLKNIFKGDICE